MTNSRIVQTKAWAINAAETRGRQKTCMDKMVIILTYHLAALDEVIVSRAVEGGLISLR